MNAPSTVLDAATDLKSRWAWHLAGLGTLLAVIGGLFWNDIAAAAEVWWLYPAYSHSFLILPISLWLIWNKRTELRAQTPTLAPKAVLAALPFLALWIIGELGTINEARQFAVIGFVQVAIVAMLGPRVYRTILFPALFLFFLVPTGQYLIPPLQRITTDFVDAALSLFAIPHYTEGTLIELPNGRFEIAEACAGLRFLTATVALGMLFAHLTFRKWHKIAIFLAACVLVPIIGNGLRAFGIIMLAYLTDNEVAVGADHLVYGWGFSIVILLLLFAVGLRFRDAPAAPKPVKGNGRRSSRAAIFGVAAVTALAIGAGTAFAFWHDSRPIIVNASALARPLAIPGWEQTAATEAWRPTYDDADAELRIGLTATKDGAATPVDLAVEYFGRMRGQRKLIAATNEPWDQDKWRPTGGTHPVTARLGGVPVRFSETLIASQSARRLVWSTYWLDGRFTQSATMVRLLQLKVAFTGDEGAAFVAISTPIDTTLDEARARLTAAAAAMGDLLARLREAGRAQSAQASQPSQ